MTPRKERKQSLTYPEAEAILEQYIHSHRLRKTPERFAILQTAMGLPPHFTSQQLEAEMRQSKYYVSRATVFNTLSLLCKCGLLRRLELVGGVHAYEFTLQTHLHTVCLGCGKIGEVPLTDSIEMLPRELRSSGFTPLRLNATLYGYCDDCTRKCTPRHSETTQNKQQPL